MLAKWKVNLLLALSAFTIVGVGFSSWTISAGSQFESEKGLIGADVVFNSSEYISYDRTKANNVLTSWGYTGSPSNGAFLLFNENGFFYDETFSTTEATLGIYLRINMSLLEVVENFDLGDTFKLGFDVKCLPNGNDVEYLNLTQEATNKSFGYKFFEDENDFKVVNTVYDNGFIKTGELDVSNYLKLIEDVESVKYLNFEAKFSFNATMFSEFFTTDYENSIEIPLRWTMFKISSYIVI